jgi:GT2 family glycosyltransferase
MTEPLVSVIVLNYNGAHLLPDCLDSFAAQDWPSLEVLVADNGSVDGSASVASSYRVRWVPMGDNLGFSMANNRAAAQAGGDYLFFVNNDMKFKPDCVRRLAEVLQRDDSLFAADPTQVDWAGSRVIHARTRLVPGRYVQMVVPPFAVDYTAPADGLVEVPWGCAGSLMVRRDRFEALGGFDPKFFIDFEDTDLCWRAWRRGWRTVYVPQAVLHHKVGMSDDQHQHLIRTPAGPLPKIWFRRRVSYHANLLRFGLKNLAPAAVAQLLVSLVARCAWHLSRRNFKVSLAILTAFMKNLLWLPDTLSARGRIGSAVALTQEALMERFAAQEGRGA